MKLEQNYERTENRAKRIYALLSCLILTLLAAVVPDRKSVV